MSETTNDTAPLTVVLVHGAFADGSSWSSVIERLQAAGIHVTAPANPCAVSHTTRPTSRPISSRFPGRSSRSATRTEVR